MRESVVALIIFLCLAAASLGTLALQHRLPSRHREDDTQNVIRLIANFFVVMTSLVMGLMINSAKNTLESVDRNIHTFAASIIVLDRTLRHYGPDADEVRQHLLAYAKRAAQWARRDDVSRGVGALCRCVLPDSRHGSAVLGTRAGRASAAGAGPRRNAAVTPAVGAR
jgi:hypothetical protein